MVSGAFPPPPVRTPIQGQDGNLAAEWWIWFTQLYTRTGGAVAVSNADIDILDAYGDGQDTSFIQGQNNIAEQVATILDKSPYVLLGRKNSWSLAQSIVALYNLTSNGFIKTSGGNGILSVDTGTYLPLVASVDLAAQTANIGAATLYPVPVSGAGLYRVNCHIVETTAGSISSTLPNVQIVYTDADTSGTVTIDATPILAAAGLGQTGLLTTNTVGTTSSGVITINAKASTNIQYQTVNYASNLAGMAYSLKIRLEDL